MSVVSECTSRHHRDAVLSETPDARKLEWEMVMSAMEVLGTKLESHT